MQELDDDCENRIFNKCCWTWSDIFVQSLILNAAGICLCTSFNFKIRTNHRPQKWDVKTTKYWWQTIRRLENNMAFIKKVPSLIKLNKKVKVKHSKSIGFYLKLCKRNAMKEKNTPLKAPTLQSKLDYPAFPNIVITVSGLASLISFFMNNYYYDPQ